MRSIFLLSLFLSMYFIACRQHQKEGGKSDWNSLTIISENRVQWVVSNNPDSSIIYDHNFGSFFTGYHKDKVDTFKVMLSQAERDSLITAAEDIISNPVQTQRRCTDFVGDLSITISYGSYSRSIKYEGICDWDSISTSTNKLSKIFREKVVKTISSK